MKKVSNKKITKNADPQLSTSDKLAQIRSGGTVKRPTGGKSNDVVYTGKDGTKIIKKETEEKYEETAVRRKKRNYVMYESKLGTEKNTELTKIDKPKPKYQPKPKPVREVEPRVEEKLIITRKRKEYLDNYQYHETKDIKNPKKKAYVEHKRLGDIVGGIYEETIYERQIYSQGGNRPKLPEAKNKEKLYNTQYGNFRTNNPQNTNTRNNPRNNPKQLSSNTAKVSKRTTTTTTTMKTSESGRKPKPEPITKSAAKPTTQKRIRAPKTSETINQVKETNTISKVRSKPQDSEENFSKTTKRTIVETGNSEDPNGKFKKSTLIISQITKTTTEVVEEGTGKESTVKESTDKPESKNETIIETKVEKKEETVPTPPPEEPKAPEVPEVPEVPEAPKVPEASEAPEEDANKDKDNSEAGSSIRKKYKHK